MVHHAPGAMRVQNSPRRGTGVPPVMFRAGACPELAAGTAMPRRGLRLRRAALQAAIAPAAETFHKPQVAPDLSVN